MRDDKGRLVRIQELKTTTRELERALERERRQGKLLEMHVSRFKIPAYCI
jgi:hypothetical protein